MADNFKGSDWITIQPNDLLVPYSFLFTVCSASTKNDGAIPYGETITRVDPTIHTESGTVCTTEILIESSLTSFTDTLWLSYPSTRGVGRYHITFNVALSNTSNVIEFDFNRLVAKDV